MPDRYGFETKTCPDCAGGGVIGDEPCHRCAGRGTVHTKAGHAAWSAWRDAVRQVVRVQAADVPIGARVRPWGDRRAPGQTVTAKRLYANGSWVTLSFANGIDLSTPATTMFHRMDVRVDPEAFFTTS